ncbi:hypothetical protein GCM10027511_39310 [Hymenobacter humi]
MAHLGGRVGGGLEQVAGQQGRESSEVEHGAKVGGGSGSAVLAARSAEALRFLGRMALSESHSESGAAGDLQSPIVEQRPF